jgi:chromatin segregation and condensation protein Rec8/ScpA/Scc1 (kleisin family)
VIVTFLALLELMKMNEFAVNQRRLLGEIEIRRKDHRPATEAVPAQPSR